MRDAAVQRRLRFPHPASRLSKALPRGSSGSPADRRPDRCQRGYATLPPPTADRAGTARTSPARTPHCGYRRRTRSLREFNESVTPEIRAGGARLRSVWRRPAPHPVLAHVLRELLPLLRREHRFDLLVRLAAVVHHLVPDRLELGAQGIARGGREFAEGATARDLAHLVAERGVLLLQLVADRLDFGALVGREPEPFELSRVPAHHPRGTGGRGGRLLCGSCRDEAEGRD